MSHGDRLLSALLSEAVTDGRQAIDLLEEFGHVYPLSKLRLLLRADRDHATEAGIWIASEMARHAAPLLSDIVLLLRHSSPKVRYFALDSVLSCATAGDSDAISGALALVDDANSSVRWKALMFLAAAPIEVLQAACHANTPISRAEAHAAGLELVISTSSIAAAVVAALGSTDTILRGYAAAAAVRLIDRDPTIVQQALVSVDSVVSRFAKDMLARIYKIDEE